MSNFRGSCHPPACRFLFPFYSPRTCAIRDVFSSICDSFPPIRDINEQCDWSMSREIFIERIAAFSSKSTVQNPPSSPTRGRNSKLSVYHFVTPITLRNFAANFRYMHSVDCNDRAIQRYIDIINPAMTLIGREESVKRYLRCDNSISSSRSSN